MIGLYDAEEELLTENELISVVQIIQQFFLFRAIQNLRILVIDSSLVVLPIVSGILDGTFSFHFSGSFSKYLYHGIVNAKNSPICIGEFFSYGRS